MDIFRAVTMKIVTFRQASNPPTVTDAECNIFNGVLGQVHREYEALANLRNNLLHATWFVGYANEAQEDFSEFFAHKQTVNKSGAGMVDLPKTAKELDDLSERCNRMAEWIRLIFASAALTEVNKNMIGKLFRFNEKEKTWEDARASSREHRS